MEKEQLSGTLVMKFGGTSVGSTEAILRCTEVIRMSKVDWSNVVVVVSALCGKR